MELAGPFQCFGIVFSIVTTSTTFLDGVDLAVVFPSTLAPVIVTAITPLITLVAGIVTLDAVIKTVVLTTVAAVVVAVWGWSERGTLAASSTIIFLASLASAYFLAVARSAVTDLGLLWRILSLGHHESGDQ